VSIGKNRQALSIAWWRRAALAIHDLKVESRIGHNYFVTALDAIKAVRAAVENKHPLLGVSQIHNNKLAIPRPQVALSKFEESFNRRQDL
jgi:hypothetical protein